MMSSRRPETPVLPFTSLALKLREVFDEHPSDADFEDLLRQAEVKASEVSHSSQLSFLLRSTPHWPALPLLTIRISSD